MALARSRRLGVGMGRWESAAPGGLRAAHCPIPGGRLSRVEFPPGCRAGRSGMEAWGQETGLPRLARCRVITQLVHATQYHQQRRKSAPSQRVTKVNDRFSRLKNENQGLRGCRP